MSVFDIFTNQKIGLRRKDPELNRHGRPAWGAETLIPARIVAGNGAIPGEMGIQEDADLIVMVKDKTGVDDLLTHEGQTYRVIKFTEVPWIDGSYIGRFVSASRYDPVDMEV